MEPTRRGLLASAAALAALPVVPACKGPEDPADTGIAEPPAPDREPEPEPWDAPGAVDADAFGWSVQAGDATDTSVILSVRTTEPTLELVVVQGEGDGWVEVERRSVQPVDGRARVELDGLTPDAVYRYAFYADAQRRSPVGRFRTALGPGGFRRVVLGATSCLGGSNPEWGNLAHAADLDLDVFLLLGDTVYADPARSLEEYRGYWERALGKPSLAALCASTSVVATWDDHEVDNNWHLEHLPPDPFGTAVTAERRDIALSAFREAVPQRIGGGELGLWRSIRWGDVVELFVLDCRGERDLGRMMSDEQLAWITTALAESTARFKLVLASVHLADHTHLFGPLAAEDRWQGYPDERDVLVRALLDTPGALVITGDMHYGAVQRLDAPGGEGEGIFEVAAGPSGSKLNLVPSLLEDAEQYPVIVTTWSFCRFDLDPATGQVEVAFVGDDGDVLAEWTALL